MPQDTSSTDLRQAVSIFGLGQQQRSPFISTVQRINAVVEMTENGREQAAIIGLAGLSSYLTVGTTPARVLFVRPGETNFYAVFEDTVYLLNATAPAQILGKLPTFDGPVWIADNGTQLFINDGEAAFVYDTTTMLWSKIVDLDYPFEARGAIFLQGRFWVYTTTGATAGRVYGSDQFDGLSWDPLNFFSPEANPNSIVSISRWYKNLVVWGDASIEFWSGVSTQIPGLLGFQPITGANTQVGLGGEREYAPVGQRLFFVGSMNGTAGIYELDGFSAVKVSTPAVDQDLATRANHPLAIATGYIIGGHALFQVTFPATTAQDAVTWALDIDTMLWCQRQSYGQPYYRGRLTATTQDRVFITDAFTGTIWEMSDAVQSEGADPLIFEVTSIHLLKNGDRLSIDSLQFDIETGLGLATSQGSDPRGIIQISKDGGHVWGVERWVPLGKIGEFKRRAVARRLGATRDFAIRFRITDPIPRRLCGAYLTMTPGVS